MPKLLTYWFFLFGPIRIGRVGIAIDRHALLFQRYRAGRMWTSWQFAWLRVYWWDREWLVAGENGATQTAAALSTSNTTRRQDGPTTDEGLTHRQILMLTLLLGLTFGLVFGGITFLSHLYAPLPDPPTVESLLSWRYLVIPPAFTLALVIARRG